MYGDEVLENLEMRYNANLLRFKIFDKVKNMRQLLRATVSFYAGRWFLKLSTPFCHSRFALAAA